MKQRLENLSEEESQLRRSQTLSTVDTDTEGKPEENKKEAPRDKKAAPHTPLDAGEAGEKPRTRELSSVREFTKVSEVKEEGKVTRVTEVTTVEETKKRTGDAQALKKLSWSEDHEPGGRE